MTGKATQWMLGVLLTPIFGFAGLPAVEWQRPIGFVTTPLAADSTGIYLPDPVRGELVKLDGTGQQIWSVAVTDAADVALDSTGVWVAGNGSARKYDRDGNLLLNVSGIGIGRKVFVTEGSVFVAADKFVSGAQTDVEVIRLDPAGNVMWRNTIGTAGRDHVVALAADSAGLYAGGVTSGAFPGFTNKGDFDAFFARFDLAGNALWTAQFGSGGFDIVSSLIAHPTGLYVAGNENSAGYLARFNTSGQQIWRITPGTGLAIGEAKADSSGIFVAGAMPNAIFSTNMALFKFRFDGSEEWRFVPDSRQGWFGLALFAGSAFMSGVSETAAVVTKVILPLPLEPTTLSGLLNSFTPQPSPNFTNKINASCQQLRSLFSEIETLTSVQGDLLRARIAEISQLLGCAP